MRRFREGWIGRVRVGTTLTAMIYRLPPILRRRARSSIPASTSSSTTCRHRTASTNIMQNKIDLALVNLPVDKQAAADHAAVPEE